MSQIVTQSLFHTTEVKANWRSQITSILVHGLLLVLALLITVPVVQETRTHSEHITLIAPQIAQFTPRIPPVRHIQAPHLIARPAVIPPVIKLPETKPIVAEKRQSPPPVLKPAPELPVVAKIEPPPASKPVEVAKMPIVPKVQVGGFGDPNAVKASEISRPAPVMMAKVGAFESPTGTGQSGAAGNNAAGVVKSTSFGSPGGVTNGTSKSASVRTGGFGDNLAGGNGPSGHGAVKSSGFGDTIAATVTPKIPATTTPVFTPVEILYKPKPAYSSEARSLRVEGQVSLEVVFQASGAVKVVRVIRGLGHGLDEAAQQAALQVRFKPATRAGVAIDQSATISITFELT